MDAIYDAIIKLPVTMTAVVHDIDRYNYLDHDRDRLRKKMAIDLPRSIPSFS